MEHVTQEDFERFTANMQEPPFVREHRLYSFKKFQDSKLPDFRYGLNISVQPYGFQFSGVQPFQSPKGNTVRINPQQQKVSIMQGKDWGIIQETDASLALQEFYNSSWNTEEDAHKLSFFHGAFSNEVALIIIPKDNELKKPILVNLKVQEGPFIPTLLVMAGENSKATILLAKGGGAEKDTYLSEEVKIVAKHGSSITFASIQNLRDSVVQVQRRKGRALRDAHIRWVDVCIGAKFTKAD
ncbi:SufD family Fe-S cluster assembly protein, partial [Candidatus Woesearchaeota archaeon]|nr:SufD family Fe-S cluster assembly protein [Candidatus Woesearchaeota archaeon]